MAPTLFMAHYALYMTSHPRFMTSQHFIYLGRISSIGRRQVVRVNQQKFLISEFRYDTKSVFAWIFFYRISAFLSPSTKEGKLRRNSIPAET